LNIVRIRRDFPVLNVTVHGRPLIYLDNAATMQMPAPVMDTIVHHYRNANSSVHRGVHTLSQKTTNAMEHARAKIASYLGAQHNHEIIFTSGTTDAINLAAQSFSQVFLHPDDEIVVSAMEHHSNLIPWQEACSRTGARLRIIPVTEDGQLDMVQYKKIVTEKTVLVAVTWVSNVLGTVNPIADIIQLAHQNGAFVLIDGAQAVKMGTVNVSALDCDFFAFSGHKLGAITGIGVLYGKESLLEQLPPVSFGGGMVNQVDFCSSTYGTLPLKFEAGTPNYAGAISLGAALDYLQTLGRVEIAIREHSLLAQTEQLISELPELHVLGRPELRSGCISFYGDGVHPYDLGALLDAQGIATRTGHLCAQPLLNALGLTSVIRISPAFYNTDLELLRLQEGLKTALARLKGVI